MYSSTAMIALVAQERVCWAQVKEVALMHSEGLLAGEMKHGPLALVDEHLPLIVIATRDRMYAKMLSVVHQLLARGARLIILCNAGDAEIQETCASRNCRLIEVCLPGWHLIRLALARHQLCGRDLRAFGPCQSTLHCQTHVLPKVRIALLLLCLMPAPQISSCESRKVPRALTWGCTHCCAGTQHSGMLTAHRQYCAAAAAVVPLDCDPWLQRRPAPQSGEVCDSV